MTKQIGPPEVTMEVTLSGITLTQTSSMCALDSIGHHTSTVAFSGNTIVKAFKDAGAEQLLQHGHQFSAPLPGNN